MTIFDVLNSILFSKKKIDLNIEEESTFNLFMVNRWLSMYSPDLTTIINSMTNNGIGQVLETKTDQYSFLYNFLPRLKFKRISYIKKKKEKETDKEEADNLKIFAKNKELSQREIKQYIDLQQNLPI